MKLSELLAELRGSILRDTSTLKSGPPDHYWADDALIRYINDAHRRFARQALCLRDSKPSTITQVTLVEGQVLYDLHPSVLRVTSARHEESDTDMLRIAHVHRYTWANPHLDWADFNGYPQSASQNRPMRYATDESLNVDDEHQIKFLVDPAPNADEDGKKINLRVIRLPVDDLVANSLSAEPEIPADWQLDMLEWAAYRALRNWDVDAEAIEKSERHRKRFDEAVAECVKEIEQKKMFDPVRWQFGGNGFTYVR